MGKTDTLKESVVGQRILLHGFFWIGVFAYGLLENWNVSENKAAILELYLAKLPVQIAIAYFVTYFLLPRFISRQAWSCFLIILLASAYLVSILYSLYRSFYFEPKYPGYFKSTTVYSAAMYFDFMKFLMYITSFFTPAAIMGLIKLVRLQHEKERQRASIEKQLLLAEMHFLKNQLNPHFLFNTLNNLYMLTLKASPRAPEVVARLSETLDYMLYRCSEHAVAIGGEIQLIENYLALEELRLSSDVVINFNAPPIPDTVTVPPLIMLALVENAFKHGVNKSIGKATVEIDLKVNDSMLMFSVRNSKSNYNSGNGEGIGLKNIQRQLELMYPGRHALKIEDNIHYYLVNLQITLN